MDLHQLNKQEIDLLIEGLGELPIASKEHSQKFLSNMLKHVTDKTTTQDDIEKLCKEDEKALKKREEDVSLLKAKLINHRRSLA
jgi:hypothetical protein